MSTLLERYSDDALMELADALKGEVAHRQQKKAQEEARNPRVKITLTVNELASLWRYGIRGDKVAMVKKYTTNSGSVEYYWCMLSGKYGAEQIILRYSMGSASVVQSIPDGAREHISPKQIAAEIKAMFTTEWQYECVIEHEKQVLHLWSCQHREGYTAYALTHQPKDGQDFVKPEGSGHYTSIEGLCTKTGIPRSSLSI